MVAFDSSTFCTIASLWESTEGNLPALLRPGPRILGICLIKESEARKPSYFLAGRKAKLSLLCRTQMDEKMYFVRHGIQRSGEILAFCKP
jgi:hypothetical protein